MERVILTPHGSEVKIAWRQHQLFLTQSLKPKNNNQINAKKWQQQKKNEDGNNKRGRKLEFVFRKTNKNGHKNQVERKRKADQSEKEIRKRTGQQKEMCRQIFYIPLSPFVLLFLMYNEEKRKWRGFDRERKQTRWFSSFFSHVFLKSQTFPTLFPKWIFFFRFLFFFLIPFRNHKMQLGGDNSGATLIQNKVSLDVVHAARKSLEKIGRWPTHRKCGRKSDMPDLEQQGELWHRSCIFFGICVRGIKFRRNRLTCWFVLVQTPLRTIGVPYTLLHWGTSHNGVWRRCIRGGGSEKNPS